MGQQPQLVFLALASALLLGIAGVSRAAAPPSSVIAVANRDAEGAIVLDADLKQNYVPTAADCRDNCTANPPCNVWVWCGAVSGCATAGGYRDPGRFQQCWLKADIPPASGNGGKFPRAKNLFDQATGWLSGTTAPGVTDSAPQPEMAYGPCSCKSDYTFGGYRFLGVCAHIEEYGDSCVVDSSCGNAPSSRVVGCASLQPCTVLLDTDLQEQKVLVSGEDNSADSAEDCCSQCASTEGCNTWTWCSDSGGCGGERFRFRQCWLKQADPNNPQPKKGYGGSPGWVSGVRMAWLPA